MTLERLKELIRAMWLVGVERQDIEKGLSELSKRRRVEALMIYDTMERVYRNGLKVHNIG